jgi:glycosyltransferase involved in cell wall biosynthesis
VIAAAAGRYAGIRRVVSILDGLPEPGLEQSVDDAIDLRRYAKAFEASQAIVVHNTDDERRLKRSGFVADATSIVLIPGAGVDLSVHAIQPLPPLAQGLVFLMIAPLERSRGVEDYAKACQIVKARAPGAKFLLAGPRGEGPGAVTAQSLIASGAVDYLGVLDDVRPALGRAHVFVYPSHAEGMPRSVLEALAAGRPVITTSAPGCRETVDERVNGCLVPPGDVAALADAMESFLKRPDLIAAMARASRIKAERRFDRREVNARLLGVLGLG